MRVTESEIIKYLQREGDQYAPLTINRLEEQVPLTDGYRADAIIDFSIQDGPSFEALVEIVPVPTPKNILEKSRLLFDYISKINKSNTVPLIIAPYIGKKKAKMLADTGISWMDISGNMLIRVSNQIYIERTGQRNRFPDTAPIKKIFQGTSSLVSRALLLKPEGFSSLYEVVNFINERNANITMSTVSKVLKSLEEELLIDRNKPLISVPDREKLLDRLTEGYINYIKRKESKTYRFSVQQPRYASLKRNVQKSNYLACGFYATQIKGLGVTNEIMICVKNMDLAKKDLDFLEPDAEFGNIKLIENNDIEIWFNSVDIEITIASIIKITIPIIDDIELYLEMMAETPRGPKIAEQLKQRILNKADIIG